MKKSGEFDLVYEDVKRWLYNIVLFSSPALLSFLMALQAGMKVEQALFVMYPVTINILIDLVRKFVEKREYR